MLKEDMILEISMKKDIPMEDVEEVLDEEERILEEERKSKKKKKCLFITAMVSFFLLGAAAAMYILEKKQKINMEGFVKKFADKFAKKMDMDE